MKLIYFSMSRITMFTYKRILSILEFSNINLIKSTKHFLSEMTRGLWHALMVSVKVLVHAKVFITHTQNIVILTHIFVSNPNYFKYIGKQKNSFPKQLFQSFSKAIIYYAIYVNRIYVYKYYSFLSLSHSELLCGVWEIL